MTDCPLRECMSCETACKAVGGCLALWMMEPMMRGPVTYNAMQDGRNRLLDTLIGHGLVKRGKSALEGSLTPMGEKVMGVKAGTKGTKKNAPPSLFG